LSIMDVCRLSIDEALRFYEGLELDAFGKKIATDVVREIRESRNILRCQ